MDLSLKDNPGISKSIKDVKLQVFMMFIAQQNSSSILSYIQI